MFEEYKYKIELHAHTSPASYCSEIAPEELVDIYRDLGADAVVITNHFAHYSIADDFDNVDDALNFYFSDYDKAVAEGEKVGVKVLLGLELCFAENSNDYLVYGVDRDDARQIFGMLGGTFAEFREKFHSDRAIVIQAHPCRDGMTKVDPALLDGVEAFNLHPNHNGRIAFSSKLAADNDLIATCGTDFHHHGHEGSAYLRFKELPNDTFELAKMLRSKDFIFDVHGFLVLPPQFRELHK